MQVPVQEIVGCIAASVHDPWHSTVGSLPLVQLTIASAVQLPSTVQPASQFACADTDAVHTGGWKSTPIVTPKLPVAEKLALIVFAASVHQAVALPVGSPVMASTLLMSSADAP